MTHYDLSWGDPNDHLFDVEIAFVAPTDDPIAHLPAWRPGRYLIQNYAANVRQWSANMEKVAKSSWRVQARRDEHVTIRYRFYAGVLDAGSSFLDDDDEAYFNGSNLFMWIDGLRSEPATLAIAAPPDWQIETQLQPADNKDGRRVFAAPDYDHLIDAPTLCSPTLTRHTFEEAGACIHLIFRNDRGIDTEQFIEPTRAIARTQVALFGDLPLSDFGNEYRFLYHVGDRWHGVEHAASCSIIVKRAELLGVHLADASADVPVGKGADHFLAITSHELFHLWNVKRILPAKFLPYDYTTETPTKLLWAMEGITSYYGELSVVRSGVWTRERYLEHLAAEIETLESAPGRHHLSLAQASFDGWLQDPSQMHDKGNAWISFYNKGEIVSALLDLSIRSRTGKSLDDVMRYLWQEYGAKSRGLEEDAIERAVEVVTGESFRDFFARYVEGTEALPYAELFGLAGVAVDFEARDTLFGARLRAGSGQLVIESVMQDGPAMQAGLLPNDELIAIDGTRVARPDEVNVALRSIAEGKAAEVISARNGVIRMRSVTPRRDGSVKVKLRLLPEESQLREGWLRQTGDLPTR